VSTPGTHRLAVLWGLAWIAAAGSQLALGLGTDATYVNEELIFAVVIVAASLCAVFSIAVIVRGFREGIAELALLGSFLTATSLLPLAHAFLIPGVLYGPNPAATTTVQLAVPISGIALLPLLRPSGRATRWREFVLAHLAATVLFAAAMLLWPNLAPAAETGSAPAIALSALALIIALAASAHYLRLAIISQHWHAMTIALGLVLIGTAPLVFIAGGPFSAAFWVSHILDVTGVLFAAGTGLIAFRRGATADALLAPLDGATPLRSLEIGLDPLVHRLVADLDEKDPITREHVVRTARLAVLVASELHLAPLEVRNVGLGAILHDIGKLEIDDAILQKPDRLSDDEFDAMKAHTVTGDRMVRASTVLDPAAPFVRGHHERVDGRGYPDRLAGDDIPLGARIVAACDAFDAMSHTRQYREGMDRDRVVSILREHQGAQWDTRVVEALLRVIDNEAEIDVLADVGRVGDQTCCHDALPV
jgi:putative nucleotidyltransferase with HDIG domain